MKETKKEEIEKLTKILFKFLCIKRKITNKIKCHMKHGENIAIVYEN